MKSRLIAGAAAVLLALIGAVMVFTYAQAAEERAVSGLDPVKVLVIQEAVPSGTAVADLGPMLALKDLPSTAVADTALENLEESAGLITAVDLIPGEQLLSERLVTPESLSSAREIEVPENFHEVSFQLEPQRVVGADIVAGDLVGIFISQDSGEESAPSETQLVMHKVLVTKVQGAPQAPAAEGEEDPAAPPAPTGSLLVTVAVNEEFATKIVFGAEFGTLWLSREAESTVENASPITIDGEVLYR